MPKGSSSQGRQWRRKLKRGVARASTGVSSGGAARLGDSARIGHGVCPLGAKAHRSAYREGRGRSQAAALQQPHRQPACPMIREAATLARRLETVVRSRMKVAYPCEPPALRLIR